MRNGVDIMIWDLILGGWINFKGVIHVGGHLGEEIGVYKTKTSNIHIFEPQKQQFDKIDNSVKKYNVALGSSKGLMNMHVANNGESSSLLSPDKHITKYYPQVTFEKSDFVVPVETLDSYGIIDCDFLSIDTQGYELEVLKGSTETLKHITFILTEIFTEELYKNCPMVSEIDMYLKNLNFTRIKTSGIGDGWGEALYISNKRLYNI